MLDSLKKTEQVVISEPNFQEAVVRIIGTAPYCSNKFSQKAQLEMVAKQLEGGQSKKGKMRKPKDFESLYAGVLHKSTDGWYGVPAAAFRNGMVSGCRTVGFAMTRAKLSIFVIHDGIDSEDLQPLVKIHGEPTRRDMAVTLANGAPDILPRALFEKWHVDLHLRWDADQFSATDVLNLLSRVGIQVGVGAGRPDSKNSCGMGWGTFRVEAQQAK